MSLSLGEPIASNAVPPSSPRPELETLSVHRPRRINAASGRAAKLGVSRPLSAPKVDPSPPTPPSGVILEKDAVDIVRELDIMQEALRKVVQSTGPGMDRDAQFTGSSHVVSPRFDRARGMWTDRFFALTPRQVTHCSVALASHPSKREYVQLGVPCSQEAGTASPRPVSTGKRIVGRYPTRPQRPSGIIISGRAPEGDGDEQKPPTQVSNRTTAFDAYAVTWSTALLLKQEELAKRLRYTAVPPTQRERKNLKSFDRERLRHQTSRPSTGKTIREGPLLQPSSSLADSAPSLPNGDFHVLPTSTDTHRQASAAVSHRGPKPKLECELELDRLKGVLNSTQLRLRAKYS